MQDIIAPQKKLKPLNPKSHKVIIIVSSLLVLALVIIATYFVTKNFLIKQEPKKQAAKTADTKTSQDSGDFVYITSVAGLNLRLSANTQSDIVWTLPYAAKIKIEDRNKDNTWYKTTYKNVTGWFSADYASKDQPEDKTKDWKSISKKGMVPFSLQYPGDWKVKTVDTEQNSFSITSPTDPRSLITAEVLVAPIDQVANSLIGDGKTLGGKTLFALNDIQGHKYVIQTVINNKVTYTEDVILLEKDGKVIKITGPADRESYGDTFNLLVWTLTFDKGNTNEKI